VDCRPEYLVASPDNCLLFGFRVGRVVIFHFIDIDSLCCMPPSLTI
jgi:hypothetical protein